MIKTKTKRINLNTTDNLNQAILDTCEAMGLSGFRLASSFVLEHHLVMIFQKTPY